MRAKFVCTELKEFNNGETANPQKTGENVSMSAVTTGSEENKSFSQYTPSATLIMHISNPNLYGFMEVGKEYYLDFSKAN